MWMLFEYNKIIFLGLNSSMITNEWNLALHNWNVKPYGLANTSN